MQELVRPVRVAFRPEHAADHHLRLREALGQHAHQRDRAALADEADRGAVVSVGGVVECAVQPGREFGRVPAGGAEGASPAIGVEGDTGVVRRVVFEQLLQLERGLVTVDQRRQAQAELERGVGAQHVAGVLHLREAIDADHAERWPPGAVDQGLRRIGRRRQGRRTVGAAGPGKALVDLVLEDRRGGARLCQALRRHFAVEALGQQLAGLAVLQPVQHLAQDAEG